MTYQSQSNGLVAFKAQSGKGTPATGSSGYVLRTAGGPGGRLTKNSYRSNEVRRDKMRTRGRHGLQKVSGSYTCEASIAACDPFFSAFFRGAYVAEVTIDQTDASLASIVTDSGGTITAGGGSWITAGVRVGDICKLTASHTAGNNDRRFRVDALTATVMTVTFLDGAGLATDATADDFTLVIIGQKLINPAAGSLSEVYFTIEEYDGDLDLSELFYDCKITSVRFYFQAGGLLMVDIGFTGTGYFATADTAAAPTLTSPTESTGLPLAVIDAVAAFNGANMVDLTSFELNMSVGAAAPEVAAATISPDVFTGAFSASLNFSMLRSDYAKMTAFTAETLLSMQVVAAENEDEPADFLSLFVPAFTIGGIDKSPLSAEAGPRTQTITVPEDLVGIDTRGGAYDSTMVKLQISNS